MREITTHFPGIRLRGGGGYLIVDTSACLSLGALKGLEDFNTAVRPIFKLVDGLVTSPGQLGKLEKIEKDDASLLVRMDWNNTLRDGSFVLPVTQPKQVPLLSAADARDLGAAGMVFTFLLGYAEEVEAACLKTTVQLALQGRQLGLPLFVEVQASGSRVSLPGKAIELGVSYALEGGADVIVVPYPGASSLQTIGKFTSVPWLLKPSSLEKVTEEWQEARNAGASGMWLDQVIFADPDPSARRSDFRRLMQPEPQGA